MDWTRLSKLAGMLGSPHDGERVNAARLLEAALQREGLTFADLAQRIANGPMIFGSRNDVRTVVVEKRMRPNPAADMAQKIIDRAAASLTAMERRFLNDILRTCEMTGGNCDLTEKQAAWLSMLEKSYLTNAMPMRRTRKPKPIAAAVLDDLGLGDSPGTFKGDPTPKPRRGGYKRTHNAPPMWDASDAPDWRDVNDIPDARRDHQTKLHSGFAAREVDFDDDIGF